MAVGRSLVYGSQKNNYVVNISRTLVDSGMSEVANSYIDLLPNRSGMARLIVGDNQEYVWFNFTESAEVMLLMHSTNVVTSSEDGKLVVRDNGSVVRVVNELGATLRFTMVIEYN